METTVGEVNESCDENLVWSLVMNLWKYHQRKCDFNLDTRLWLQEHPDFLKLMEEAKGKGWLEVWPNHESGDIDAYRNTPALYTVKILPHTLERLRERKAHSQITVDGQKIDVRNGTNQEIMTSRLRDLATIAIPCWIVTLQDRDPAVRHGCHMRLQKAVLLRGAELEAEYPDLWKRLQDLLTVPWSPAQ